MKAFLVSAVIGLMHVIEAQPVWHAPQSSIAFTSATFHLPTQGGSTTFMGNQVAPHEPMMDISASPVYLRNLPAPHEPMIEPVEVPEAMQSVFERLQLDNYPDLSGVYQYLGLDKGKTAALTVQLIENMRLTPDQVNRITKLINFSPTTIQLIIRAVKAGEIRLFEPKEHRHLLHKVRSIMHVLHLENWLPRISHNHVLMKRISRNIGLIDSLLDAWTTDAKFPPTWMLRRRLTWAR